VTSPGQSVTQGQVIAVAGDTGGQQEIHLHFEARDTCTFGQVNSGKSFPLRAIMGIWWSQWYAPPPYLTVSPTKGSNSGRAEYPVNSTPPAGMLFTATPRHLSNTTSPSGFPSAYASNINSLFVDLHMGASPDVSRPFLDAYFQIYEFRPYLPAPWYQLSGNQPGPTYHRNLFPNYKCGSNGQYCFSVRSAQTDGPSLSSPRYVDVHSGLAGSQPHIAAFYNVSQATVTLEYAWPGALRYIVYENHGGQTFIAYDGLASQITVNRITGAPNAYQVRVQISPLQWINSQWLYLHNTLVSIPTSTPTVTRTPTRTPTSTPTPTWPAPDSNCSDGQCVFAVSGSADDAGTKPVFSSCAYYVTDSEIYMGECSAEGIISGFRFPGVNVSQGAQIASAYLAVWVDGPYSDLLQLKLYGEASNDAAAFSATNKPSDRPLTVASVNWTVPTSDFWYDGTQFRFTPNIAPLVQEIVNRPGWGSGNAMVMIVKNIDSSIYRRVYAYDRELNTTHTVRLVITLTNP